MKTIIRISLGLLLLAQMSLSGRAESGGVIRTVAGNGISGYSGDGGPATSAQLKWPEGVAVDSAGNLYVADTWNHRVRKVTPDGMISTVAGNGTEGFSGDGGPAILAQLDIPTSVTLDSAGNLYIADWYNGLVRKVTPIGIISTVAGGGEQSPGDGGPATSARMLSVVGVAVDRVGNLYFSESNDGWFPDRVRKVTPDGVISTVAGGGTQSPGDGRLATAVDLYPVGGIELDSSGNLYIASGGRVHNVTPDGVLRTVAGGGTQYPGNGVPATSADLYPTDIAIDSAGNLYISDVQSDCILKVTPEGMISTVAGNGTSGFGGDGGPATLAQLNFPGGVALDSSGSFYIADFRNHRIRKVDFRKASINLNVNLGGGAATAATAGSTGQVEAGYGVVTTNSGAVPYATAVVSFSQNGVVVSEAGVAVSPPTTHSRIFIDFRTNVAAKSNPLASGAVNTDTGFAIVNPGNSTATIQYNLRDINGAIIASGTGTMAAGAHDARFVNQLGAVAAGFVIPANFAGFGALDITSDRPVSVVALRLTTNQRNETLITTTPSADLNAPLSTGPLYVAQMVDGGGYQTTFFFLNTSSIPETGTVQFFTDSGAPLSVTLMDGGRGASIPYNVPPGGYAVMQTNGTPATQNAGWALITPGGGNTPVVAGVFGFTKGGILVTESGIPSATPTTHARIYVDQTVSAAGSHDTGLAIVNPAQFQGLTYTVNAFQADGVTPVGIGGAQPQLNGYGHVAKFVREFITGLPSSFIGVLDISAPSRFAALTLRSLYNARGDFLLTTFPIADATREAPNPLVFPQIGDGGGFRTQFILLGTSGAASTTISFYGDDGSPLAVGKMAGGNR